MQKDGINGALWGPASNRSVPEESVIKKVLCVIPKFQRSPSFERSTKGKKKRALLLLLLWLLLAVSRTPNRRRPRTITTRLGCLAVPKNRGQGKEGSGTALRCRGVSW